MTPKVPGKDDMFFIGGLQVDIGSGGKWIQGRSTTCTV